MKSWGVVLTNGGIILYSNQNIDALLENMQKLFMLNTVTIRPDRVHKKRLDKDRDKSTIFTNSVNYPKRKKKVIG